MPTVDPEQGELRTVTQLVSDAAEVCERFQGFPMFLTCIIGAPSLPILPCHGSIRFACYPNTSGPPLPAFIPTGLQFHQIQKKFGLEVQSGDDEIRLRFWRTFSRWKIGPQGTYCPRIFKACKGVCSTAEERPQR